MGGRNGPVRIGCAVLAALAGACATAPAANVPHSARIPSTPLSLGDYRGASIGVVAQNFSREVTQRYAVGLQLGAIGADLRRNEFTCGAGASGGRGDPPDQTCRRTLTVEGCTHTWQVLMYDAGGNGALARSRALYDRRCGGEGLLGGPG